MNPSFWSDEDRLFVRRRIGFGWSLNFKFIAKKLGWVRSTPPEDNERGSRPDQSVGERGQESRTERLRRQIEDSRYEERR